MRIDAISNTAHAGLVGATMTAVRAWHGTTRPLPPSEYNALLELAADPGPDFDVTVLRLLATDAEAPAFVRAVVLPHVVPLDADAAPQALTLTLLEVVDE